MELSFRRLRPYVAAAAVLGAVGMLPASASATWGDACSGSPITGRGASFQAGAQAIWASVFNAECTTAGVTYESLSSSQGRIALGANGDWTTLDTRYAFGAADEPPTEAQLAIANEGNPATSADDDELKTIPVAHSAISIAVQLPVGCRIPSSSRRITADDLERAFRGATTTWGDLSASFAIDEDGIAGGPTRAECEDKRFGLATRSSSSGTQFQFKQYLFLQNSAAVSGSDTWQTLANTAYPTATAGYPSNSALAAGLSSSAFATDGGIGFIVLNDARANGFTWDGTETDRLIWLHLERSRNSGRSGTFASPAANGDGARATPGSNCAAAVYTVASGGYNPLAEALPLAHSWEAITATNSPTAYPLCALTYMMNWRDGAPKGYTFNQMQTVHDYLLYVTGLGSSVGDGQADLAGTDYASITETTVGDTPLIDLIAEAMELLLFDQ